MTPSRLRAKVVAERAAWVRQMVASLRALPASTYVEFASDLRNFAAAESYLRRALEALLDLCRHVLSKGFGEAPSEYKELAPALMRAGVISVDEADLLRQLAGYRNRMVHFYQEVSHHELYEISKVHLADVDQLLEAVLQWIRTHPESIDQQF